jgi:pyrophosphatase PpaX
MTAPVRQAQTAHVCTTIPLCYAVRSMKKSTPDRALANGNQISNRIEGVLFDWDGTLLNSYAADSAAYMTMFREMGIAWTLDDLAANYSPNWYHVYRAARLPRARWDAADAAWRKQYAQHRPKLIPGARRVLLQVAKQYRLGLVTSGDRDRVQEQLRDFGLLSIFAARVCSGDTLRKKPHPQPLNFALRRMGLLPERCIYVGDSPHDLEMARRARVRAVAVLGPFPTEKQLRAAKPEFLLKSITELPQLLGELQD